MEGEPHPVTSPLKRASDATAIAPAAKAIRRAEVAYLCMEFAVREGIELYSGGLGILAGDIVKTSYDRNLPLFGIGIFWDEGYTCQRVTKSGGVEDSYPKSDRSQIEPVELAEPLSVSVKGKDIELHAFTVKGLGEKLFLLEPVKEEDRWITRRLYQGGEDDRLAQETILGVGGVRLIRALGMKVDIFHFNEGHPVFAAFELTREKITSEKLSFHDAVLATKKQCAFTTHTPVKAGNEFHGIDKVLSVCAKALGLSAEQLEIIGGKPFGMSEAAMHFAFAVNAVSQLHRETAAKMWEGVKLPHPIVGITNGVHVPSWQDSGIRNAFEAEEAMREETGEVIVPAQAGDDALWKCHQEAKNELLEEIERRTGSKLSLDNILIGFARRAAIYKRHTLLFYANAANRKQKEEPKSKEKPKLLTISANEKAVGDKVRSGDLQVAFSGKAHPQDEAGKKQIELLVSLQKDWPKGLIYLENYDMKMGRLLTRGCDVWLNNPIRPMEASGTSGMKAAMNGVLNCSILDGWWPEGCENGVTGWQIGKGEQDEVESSEMADERDSQFLHEVLLKEVLPTYYDDKEKKGWRTMMRHSIKMSQRQFSADRMMDEYMENFYPLQP